MSSAKRWLANLTLALIGIVTALLIIEGILRTLKPPFVVGITHFPCIYQEDHELGYRYSPRATGWMQRNFEIDSFVRINSTGFHDIEHETTGNDQLRIVAIGDSFTAGLEVGALIGWTQVLQRELHERGYPPADVVNLGLDGTGTDVHLALLKQYAPIIRPHLVILALHSSDIEDVLRGRLLRECYKGYVVAFQNEDQRKALRILADILSSRSMSSWLFENIYVFRAITFIHRGRDNPLRTNFLQPSHIGIEIADTAYSATTINSIFQQLVDLSEQYDFDLVTIPVPEKDRLGSLEVLRSGISQKLFEEVNVVDTSAIVERLLEEERRPYEEMFWLYDGHLNAYGHRIFGLAVARCVDHYLKAFLPHP